jgi:preprotein translocase SecE subunit
MASATSDPNVDAVRGTGIRATIAELGRVVWPTREELFRMTTIVIGTVVVFAVFIAAVDAALTPIAKFIVGTRG